LVDCHKKLEARKAKTPKELKQQQSYQKAGTYQNKGGGPSGHGGYSGRVGCTGHAISLNDLCLCFLIIFPFFAKTFQCSVVLTFF
jgi:hypothetical protein